MRLKLAHPGLIVLCSILLAGCNSGNDTAGAPSKNPRQEFLHASDSRILDSKGREVLLRGLNIIALRSDRNHPTYRQNGQVTPAADLYDLQDLQKQDFALISSMGFNAIRLIITWEFAEPDPPPAPYNKRYFKLVDQAIKKARAHGLSVVLDFGQFAWGRSLGGNAGAPAWTVSKACKAKARPVPGSAPQAAPAVKCAYTEFWKNQTVNGAALQDAYIKLWQFVAKRYRNNPGVAVYDLYNEPLPANIESSIFEDQYLYPFYRRLARAIRKVDPQHPVGFQPIYLHSVGLPTLSAARPLGIPNAIYLPHDYTTSGIKLFTGSKVDPSLPSDQAAITSKNLREDKQEARAYKAPLVIGETGWSHTGTADGVGGNGKKINLAPTRQFASDLTAVANNLKISWLWFNYSSIDRPFGINYRNKLYKGLVRQLAEPFPRATAGRLVKLHFDSASKTYTQRTQDTFDAPSKIALPLRWQYPKGACIDRDGKPVARIDGQGQVTQVAASASVKFHADSQTLVIGHTGRTLTISPHGDCGS